VLSSSELMGLVAELNLRRIPMVGGERVKKAGGEPAFRPDEVEMLKTARRLHQRYVAGKYEHEVHEARQIVDLCYRMIDWHNRNKGLSERKMPEIVVQPLSTTTPCAPGTYAVVCHTISNGELG
jgi:hypothetical protein